LSIASAWKMGCSFLFNTPYPTAPFSTLFLFGRGQDLGFQKPIGDSPRKRHHVRFWALGLDDARATAGSTRFWFNEDRPPEGARVLWVGAGTKDTGFGLTRITFQITHATDADTNLERDFIMDELRRAGVIREVTAYHTGDRMVSENVNHYTTDGEVALARLSAGTMRPGADRAGPRSVPG